MNPRAQIRMLPDGRRLHLHDGPIDVILEAFGTRNEVEYAYRAVTARFMTVLDELCSELTLLRQPTHVNGKMPTSSVARRMVDAVQPFCQQFFITPMAAVAGAVAAELLETMTSAAQLSRAYVNDGGDIALHLRAGEQFVIGMVENPELPSSLGTTVIPSSAPIRGIATSGWRGRSFSLGIADSVTVLAKNASAADAAATIVANAVDLPNHPHIRRSPACDLVPDSDLGDRCVTQDVPELASIEIDEALAGGVAAAELCRRSNLICAAALTLQGQTRIVGHLAPLGVRQLSMADRRMAHA